VAEWVYVVNVRASKGALFVYYKVYRKGRLYARKVQLERNRLDLVKGCEQRCRGRRIRKSQTIKGSGKVITRACVGRGNMQGSWQREIGLAAAPPLSGTSPTGQHHHSPHYALRQNLPMHAASLSSMGVEGEQRHSGLHARAGTSRSLVVERTMKHGRMIMRSTKHPSRALLHGSQDPNAIGLLCSPYPVGWAEDMAASYLLFNCSTSSTVQLSRIIPVIDNSILQPDDTCTPPRSASHSSFRRHAVWRLNGCSVLPCPPLLYCGATPQLPASQPSPALHNLEPSHHAKPCLITQG
jgi:hypothetical protein